MKDLLKFVLDRLKEKTTWIGLTGFVTALGVSISPEQAEAIAAAGVAIVGAILTFTKEKK
tara:strand:- start:1910 stop:2089 length:180 start_codon:yes stop_codon:yes gene_type:complete